MKNLEVLSKQTHDIEAGFSSISIACP